MPSFFLRTVLSIRSLILMLLLFTIAGCGSVEWFPEYVRLPTTPNEFSIPNKSDVDLATSVTSDAITVSGLTGDSSPITITGPALDSKYSINGATATDVAGTVKNGDQVKVTHTSATSPGVLAVSTLTIGDRKSEFISSTKVVAPPVFSAPIQSSGFLQVKATLIASDIRPHTVSIKDNAGSANPEYAIVDLNSDVVNFVKTPQTFTALNGRQIFVRNIAGVTTILTIDGTEFTINLSGQ